MNVEQVDFNRALAPLYTECLRLCGNWLAESCLESPGVILEKYKRGFSSLCFLSGVKERCLKFTVAAGISLLLLLLVAGILLGYYCESWIYLTEAAVSLIPPADCNSSTAHSGGIWQDMLCAAEPEPGAGACHPDSGGPLVTQMDGLWWLLGDGVWGGHCNGQNKPGVYTNIKHHLNWIYRQMQKHQDV